jgi:ribonuclease J
MNFGDIRVKPMVVDHSALDAYMFLIEADGKRTLFTGDFREHGITGQGDRLEKMLKKYVGSKVDLLITEGTMLSRIHESNENKIITEKDLGTKAKDIFLCDENKYCFVLVSSTNLDSIMEFYHAIPYNRALVCDAYQAEIMKIAMEDKEKYYKEYRPDFLGGVKRPVYIVGDVGEFHNVKGYRRADIKKMKEKGFVMFIRANANPSAKKGRFDIILDCFAKDNPLIVYSMWEGYLQGKHRNESLVKFLGDFRTEHLHTSGHAYIDTIKKVIDIVNPMMIIPMHTECAHEFHKIKEFEKYANRIKVPNDGEVFEPT